MFDEAVLSDDNKKKLICAWSYNNVFTGLYVDQTPAWVGWVACDDICSGTLPSGACDSCASWPVERATSCCPAPPP